MRRYGERCLWTVKGEGGLSRREFEIEIPSWVFDLLWAGTGQRRIEKIRHQAPWQGLTLEVDVYSGRLAGLVALECEFPDEAAAAAFSLPGWAADAREVTDDPRYQNRALAEHGLPGER